MPKGSKDDSHSVLQQQQNLEWNSLGLWTELVESITQQPILQAPTAVQRKVIPHLLQDPMPSTLFVAATGSGKTLAYTLPLLQQLKNSEVFWNATAAPTATPYHQQRRPKRPRALILAPTRELCQQITSVIKANCHVIKLSSQVIVGGGDLDYGKQRAQLNRPMDILVATPGRLLKHWKDKNVFLSSLDYVLLDEMDTLLEQGFSNELRQILYPLMFNTPKGEDVDVEKHFKGVDEAPKIVLTSATMTKSVLKMLGKQGKHDDSVQAKKLYTKRELLLEEEEALRNNKKSQSPRGLLLPPNIEVLKTEGLHKAVPRLQQVFVDVGNTDKLALLVDLASQGGSGAALKGQGMTAKQAMDEGQDQKALTMIFCNTAASCRAVQYALGEAGINSLSYHGDLNSIARTENLRRFRIAGGGTLFANTKPKKKALQAEEAGTDLVPTGNDLDRSELFSEAMENLDATRSAHYPSILVCTDLAARGLDVPQVDHVIMFDFPLNSVDYLHRSGRTARGTLAGRVTALVSKRDKVLAQAIERAVQRGEPLDGLSSRKSDYLPGGRVFESQKRIGGGSGPRREKGNLLRGKGNKRIQQQGGRGRRYSTVAAGSKRSGNNKGKHSSGPRP